MLRGTFAGRSTIQSEAIREVVETVRFLYAKRKEPISVESITTHLVTPRKSLYKYIANAISSGLLVADE